MVSLGVTAVLGLFALLGLLVGFATLITVGAGLFGVNPPKKLRKWSLGFETRGFGAIVTILFGLLLILLSAGTLRFFVSSTFMDRVAGKTKTTVCTVEEIDYWTGGRVYCRGLKEPLELFGAFRAQADVPALLALAKFRGVPINVEYWLYSRQIKRVWFDKPVKVNVPDLPGQYAMIDVAELSRDVLEDLGSNVSSGSVNVPIKSCLVTRLVTTKGWWVPKRIIKVGCYDESIEDTKTRYYEVIGSRITGDKLGRVVGRCAGYLIELPVIGDKYVPSKELVAECKRVVR